jgi:hypothetical protein
MIKLEDLNFIAISLSLNIAFPFVCAINRTHCSELFLSFYFSVCFSKPEQKSTLTLLILWYLHFHRSLPLTRTWIINLKWEVNENCSLFSLLSRQWMTKSIKGSNNNDMKILDYKTHSMILLSIIQGMKGGT